MKVLVDLAIALLVFVNDNQCPPEQEADWEVEKLLRHEDCDKFYKCTFGKPVEHVCPPDLFFNLDTWQCDWPENVDCSGRNVPDMTSTTLPPTTTSTPSTQVPTTSTTTSTTTAPTTTTSTTSTQTSTTTITTTHQPVTTTTTVYTSPTTTTSTPSPNPDFLPNGCPVDPHIHWLLPHESDCNLFYYCLWGEKALTDCPSTLHFNRVIQVCDWPSDAGCA